MSLTAAQSKALAKVDAWARKYRDLSEAPAELDGYIDWAIKSGFYQITVTRSGKVILESSRLKAGSKVAPAQRVLGAPQVKQVHTCPTCSASVFRARSRATGKTRLLDTMPAPGGVLTVPDVTMSLPYFLVTKPGEIPHTEADMRPGLGYGFHNCSAASLFDPTEYMKGDTP